MKTVRQVVDFLEALGEVVGAEGLSDEMGAEVVCHLSEQSCEVEEGTLFVAKQGARVDALDFVPERGRWVLIERAQSSERRQKVQALRARGVFVFEVAHLGALLAVLADWFYDSPSRQLKVVGVTGTNGKSSTTFYAAQLLMHQGFQVGVMGTLGVGVFPQLRHSANTTLEGVSLQRSLADFVQAGVRFVLMEVSSHAVALGRIEGVVFETLALTQVSSDHLDFHQTQADYEAAKLALFERWPSRGYVINGADGVGKRVVRLLQARAQREEGGGILTYSAQAQVEAALRCVQPVFSAQGLSGQLVYQAEVSYCRVPLWGAFNIENVLCAVGIVLQQGIAFEQGVSGLPYLSAVPGRMQVLVQKPTVILDYAHTADGLLQVLKAARLHFSQNEGRLWLVFGCGGERDREKRPQMGAVALQYADRVVITNDNPRCEAPVRIVRDILSGMVGDAQAVQRLEGERWTADFERFLSQSGLGNVAVILDRALAISEVIAAADEKDVVLIVGKGHETTQVFCEEVLPFSDADVVAGLLGRG